MVNLSSIMHHSGSIENLEEKIKGAYKWAFPVFSYSDTKLAMLAFTRVLAARLKSHGNCRRSSDVEYFGKYNHCGSCDYLSEVPRFPERPSGKPY